jgi:hypothetical protein
VVGLAKKSLGGVGEAGHCHEAVRDDPLLIAGLI